MGKFAIEENGISKCKGCPQGRFGNKSGLTSVDQCIVCAAGKYGTGFASASESQCAECAAGRWSDATGISVLCTRVFLLLNFSMTTIPQV